MAQLFLQQETQWYLIKQWGTSLENTNKYRLSNSHVSSPVLEPISPIEFIYYILHYWKPQYLEVSPPTNRDNIQKLVSPLVERGEKIYIPPFDESFMANVRTKYYYKNLKDYQYIMLPLFIDEFWSQLKQDYQENWTEDESPSEHHDSNNKKKVYEFKSTDRQELSIINMPNRKQNDRKVCSFKLEDKTNLYNDYLSKGDLVKIEIKETNTKIFGYIALVEKQQEVIEDELSIDTTVTYTIWTKTSFKENPKLEFSFTMVSLGWLDLYLPFIDVLINPLTKEILWPKPEKFEVSPITDTEDINEYLKPETKEELNQAQQEIVATITKIVEDKKPKICLIKGPPGTGKSRVIVNIVESILCRNPSTKILICAPSNKAVDELVLRLMQKKFPCEMVRIGSEKKFDKRVKSISLKCKAIYRVIETKSRNNLNFACDDVEKKIYDEIKDYIKPPQDEENKKDPRDQFCLSINDYLTILGICKILRLSSSEIKKIQKKVFNFAKKILKSANIISCTLSSCYTSSMMRTIYGEKDGHKISVCIVDEATHATELLNLIPLLLGVEIMILVGDSKQLRPVVISHRASKAGFSHSFYSRIEKYFLKREKRDIINLVLNEQYRMHETIAQWPNNHFYDGIIENRASISSLNISNYKIFDHFYKQKDYGRLNQRESGLVIDLIHILIEHFVTKNMTPSICIITPYNSQRKSLNDRLNNYEKDNPEISKVFNIKSIKAYTIDSFQGSESDIIIVSCVRSNGLGFVGDPNRLCVALTRAKHTLVILGNFETFKYDENWEPLLRDAHERKVYVDLRGKSDSEIKALLKSHMLNN